jgi:predicted ATPase
MTKKPQQLRFTRLKLTNWRNFREADLSLEKRVFIVGPNASGKSNLLDAIRFLSEIAQASAGGLQAAINARGSFSALRCLHSRRTPYVEIDAHIGTDDRPEAWRYLLRINMKSAKFPTVVQEAVWKDGESVLNREQKGDSDALEFSQTSLEQVSANKDFRELAEFLGSCRYLHVVPQIVRDRARGRSEGEDPFGGDLLRRMKDMKKNTREARLQRISEGLKIAVPQFGEIKLEDDAEGVPHLIASYEHWRPNASKQSEATFSDGALRLIGLLWSISEKGGTLLLEEPELSLNDAVVAQLPRMFATMQKLSGRQVITTTHSWALLSDLGIGLKEVHRITVDKNGSAVESINDDKAINAQVEAGMTVSEAVFPLLTPVGVDALGKLDVAG